MAIPISKYVNIVSGVGAGVVVAARDLITRIFSTSMYVDPNTILEFTSADDVGAFFGTTGPEYRRAVFYFGWISPLIARAKKISFARLVTAAAGAAIFGGGDVKTLVAFTAQTAGRIAFLVDGIAIEVVGINLSGAASFAAIATLLQTAIQASGGVLTAVTVSYDATRNSFVLQDSASGSANSITVVTDSTPSSDVGTLLEWTVGAGANFVGKATVQSPLNTFLASIATSNNFGTFVMPSVTTLSDIIAVAQANKGQNVDFIYLISVTSGNAAAWSAALLPIGGVGLTLQSPLAVLTPEYPEMCPGIILAATQYARANSKMNYMYRQFALTPSVLTKPLSDIYDALRVNYYGVTQTAGQLIAFYQRGTLMGGATDPVDMNVYANEIWLKDQFTSQLLALQLTLADISANSSGQVSVVTTMQTIIDSALSNGVIAVGNVLTTLQQLYITEQTNDPRAWQQVQNIGYWLSTVVTSSTTTDGRTEYQIAYVFIYAKDNAVRAINGQDVLI